MTPAAFASSAAHRWTLLLSRRTLLCDRTKLFTSTGARSARNLAKPLFRPMATTANTNEEAAAAARAATVERALTYPFERPAGDFLFRGGAAEELPADFAIPAHRTAVLGYGSNAAPGQLLRKYGVESEVPVLSVQVRGLDTVYSAGVSHYASVPSTVHADAGVQMRACVTLLTDAQLERMHTTEQGYLYCRLRRDAGVQVTWRGAPLQPDLFAYVAPKLLVDGRTVSLDEIPATGRDTRALAQPEINSLVLRTAGWDESLEDFIVRNAGDATRREAVSALLVKQGMLDDGLDACWEVVEKLGTRLGWDESAERSSYPLQ